MAYACVLLAAGRGERLRPLTDEVAKPALPVCDVPLIEWPLARLTRACSPVVVNASHLPDPIVEAARRWGADVVIESPGAYGTAGTLSALRARLADEVVTWNADLMTDLDPEMLMRAHSEGGAAATAAVSTVDRRADFEISGGRAVGFLDRRERAEVAGARFLGAAVLGPGALSLLPGTTPAGLGETVLRTLAGRGDLAVFVHGGFALDVGTPGRYVQACEAVARGRAPAAPAGLPGTVRGGAYLGPGASAAPGTLRPGAVVLAGARVEDGARVERAVVWPGEIVPRGTLASECVWFRGGPVTAR